MGQKPCGGGVKAERWGSRDKNHGNSFRKDSSEHKSREVHGQLGRQYVLRWWGCLFIFTGPEKRADVQRVAERGEEGMMAEPETWGDGTGDPSTNRRLAIKRWTCGTTSSEKGQWNMIFYGGCEVRTPLPELERQASGENVKLLEKYYVSEKNLISAVFAFTTSSFHWSCWDACLRFGKLCEKSHKWFQDSCLDDCLNCFFWKLNRTLVS